MEASQPAATDQPQDVPRQDVPRQDFGQNENISCSARIKANSPYFKTIVGILKIVGFVFGVIAVGLVFDGYQNATLFDRDRDVHRRSSSSCRRSNTTFCELNTYFTDSLCKKEYSNGTVCVNTFLISFSVTFICVTWKITFIGLCVHLLRRPGFRTPKYFRTEIYGHLLAACLVIVSGLCIILYFMQVKEEDLCGNKNLKAEATDYVLNGPKLNSSSPNGRSFFLTTTTEKSKEQTTTSVSSSSSSSTSSSGSDNELRINSVDDSKKIEWIVANLTEQCPEMHFERYHHWIFLIGSIFALITGILYITIAAFSKKESSHAVEPVVMVMGPNGPQLKPSSQAQVQSASKPNPESDVT